jgi:23S rRNA (pseudouridine1915-N3)-methyltransferase
MHIRIVAVGKTKERYLADGIAEYEKRLRPYVKLLVNVIADEKRPAGISAASEEQVREREGERILAAIPPGAVVVALDVQGRLLSSQDLACRFRDWEIAGKNSIVFVIGGDLGLPDAVLSRADLRLSISPMTFTHQMVRLILLEQIYRAVKMNHGEPYHK